MVAPADLEILRRVVAFVAKHRGCRAEDIFPESRLLHDLGTDGMDADELLAGFRDEFRVDFSGFSFDRHFGPEAGWTPFALLSWLADPQSHRKVPITILDLCEAAATNVFPDLSDREAV